MGLPVGAVIEATLKGLFCNQTILSTFHYRVLTASATVDVAEEVEDFITQWSTTGAASLVDAFLAVVPSNYQLVQVVGQAIRPVRYRRITQGASEVGGQATTQTANLQASITTGTTLAGRNQIGGLRLPAPTDQSTDGVFDGAYITLLEALCAKMIASITITAGGGIYRPCIYHRSPNANPWYHDIFFAFPQREVRILRRRTVGLGI